MMMVLTLAQAQAALATKAQVRAIVADRESVIPGVPRARAEPPAVVAPQHNQASDSNGPHGTHAQPP